MYDGICMYVHIYRMYTVFSYQLKVCFCLHGILYWPWLRNEAWLGSSFWNLWSFSFCLFFWEGFLLDS